MQAVIKVCRLLNCWTLNTTGCTTTRSPF